MQTFTLLVHRDVDARLAELDVSLRASVRQKVIWAETQLAMTGRAPRVKGTSGQAWRRTPVRGNEYYLWWAPAEAVGAASSTLERTVAIRDLRHHDRLAAPPAAAPQDYRVVHPRELDPRTPLQASVAGDAAPSGITARLVHGQPGTGKTLALLYAARDLAASQRVLYVTYTQRLAEEALLFARANGIEIGAQIEVVTLSGLESAILGDAASAEAESPILLAERFQSLVQSLDSTIVGPWFGKGHSLWAEARASLVGMALPFAWRRGPLLIPPGEMLARELYRKVSGLDEDAADRAHHIAEIALRRGLLGDQTRARAALDTLVRDPERGVDLGRVGAVLVDEVQDLTPVEIALLLEVARATARPSGAMLFVAAGDESQTVHPSGFEWAIAKDLVHQRLDREPSEVALRHPTRNPRGVSALVQKTAALYKILSKELRPSGAAPGEPGEGMDAGRVMRCDPPDDAAFQALVGALVATPGRALVMLGRPAETGERSDPAGPAAGITFTPAEIKGLERRTVVVTGLHEALGTLGRLTSRATQRGRFLDGLEARHLVDSVRVALSRATETLVLLGPALSPVTDAEAAQLDLLRDVEAVPWDEVLRVLSEDDLTDVERARGFLDEAREHEERDDTGRARERLGHAEAIARRLEDPTLSAAVLDLGARLDAKAQRSVVAAPTEDDFDSLEAAIDAAPAGARLLIPPGSYEGPFTFSKDIELVGDGERGDVVLRASDECVVAVEECKVTLENVTLLMPKDPGGDAGAIAKAAAEAGITKHAVTVMSGEVCLRGCDIVAGGGAGLTAAMGGCLRVEGCRVQGGLVGVLASPGGRVSVEGSEVVDNTTGIVVASGSKEVTVRKSSVRNTTREGIVIQENTIALIEESDISQTTWAAIYVQKGARPVVRQNRIHQAEACGIWIEPGGGGVFEGNDVFENKPMGIRVGEGAVPTVLRNRVYKNRGAGIAVNPKGGGTFEGNEIEDNEEMGFVAGADAEVLVKGGRIRANGSVGLWVQPGGAGTFEGIDISANRQKPGVILDEAARPVLRHNRVHHHALEGVFIDGGAGELHDNDIFENTRAGVFVRKNARALVRGNRIHHNSVGVFVGRATGTFEDNDIHTHKTIGVRVSGEGDPTFRRNRIRRSGQYGVWVSEQAQPIFEDNDISEGGTIANVQVYEASPTFRNNRVHHGQFGIDITNRSRGVFEGNEIFENVKTGVFVRDGSAPTVRGNRVHDNRDMGIAVQFGAGTIVENEIFGNRGTGLRTESSEVVVQGNRIDGNAGGGVYVQPKSAGLFEQNNLAANKKWGFAVAAESDPTVRGNRVHGSAIGIAVCMHARGTYTGNDVRGNTHLGMLVDVTSTPVSCEGNISDPAGAPTQRNAGPARGRRGRRAR